jgi:Fe-S cluster assembly protein SufB
VEGCLPAGEQVALGDRWTNIEQVKPGDWIPTETGLLAKVKSVMTRPYHGELVVIRPISRYNTFRLTPEHPVLAIKRPAVLVKRQPRKHWKAEVSTQLLNATRPTYIPAGELREGDFLVYPKIKPLPAQEQPSKEQLRLLGYYLAEGSAYLHKILNVHVVSFSFGLQERSLVGEVKQLIHDLTGKRAMEIQSPRKHGTEVRIYSKELHDFVIEHAGKGAASKQLSAVVMAQPDELLRELVETYAAGDGNIAFRGRSEMRRLITASESLARQLQEILGRLGIYASIQFRQGRDDMLLGRHITRGDQWWVVYTYNKHMGEVRACADYFLVPIKETRREPYTGMVFNLDVEAPNSYLVRGFAVHNCTAPIYRTDSLHAAVVEVIVKKGARARYTTIQNWSPNVYNLVTKRAFVYEDAIMEWLDGNLGSKRTMKYPSVFLWGKGARGDVLSVALAGTGQHQDAGAKAIHLAPYTSSTITSKSVSHSGGKTTYRGQLKIIPGAKGAKSNVRCDALILDGDSSSETIPVMNIFEKDVTIGHEASVGRVSEDQLFYLMSRGIDGDQALSMIVNGFIEPITKELPLEYAVELNRLIRLEMEGSVG